MIHISKQQDGYIVTKLSGKGEILSQSKVFNTKEACWRNIRMEIEDCYVTMEGYYEGSVRPFAMVQDDCLPVPIVYHFRTKKIVSTKEPVKPYAFN
jgi:hypothetical protein